MSRFRREIILVTVMASAVALAGVRPHAGAWNDGSRLAAVESLIERGTFAIDDSVFVEPPPGNSPYPPDAAELRGGTLDKMRIGQHYYSDKAPVPTLLLAGAYGLARSVAGLRVRESPHAFCWLMNLLGGAVPYIVAVVAMHLISVRIGLARRQRWLLTLSFALATIAPAYARFVNNHMMLLGVAAALTLQMLVQSERITGPRDWLALGTLAGVGYTIDLGLGPMLLGGVGGWVLYRAAQERSARRVIVFGLAALPWLATHHAVNFAIGGTIGPANARPEYFDWPGCPFDSHNMTGVWHHAGAGSFALYALDLLIGQRGFLGHNLPLFLAGLGLPIALRRAGERPVVVAALAWSALAFLAYAATSNNYAGLCLSIRWFVPMLAPAYLVLALLVRERPERAGDLLLLSAANSIGAAAGWWFGPWARPPLVLYWSVMAGGLIGWAVFRYARHRLRVRRPQAAPGQKWLAHHLALQFSPPESNNTVCSVPRRAGESHVAAQEGRRAVR